MKLHPLPLQSSIRPFSVHYRQCSNERSLVTCGGCENAHMAAVGVIRLVYQLSQDHLLGKKSIVKLVVDAGTGTTAIGLALGTSCLGHQWEITAVMLADTANKYREHEKQLISDFRQDFAFNLSDCLDDLNGGIVQWVEWCHPRKFGNVIRGEIEVCQRVAQQTGVLVDPVYTLAAWEMATLLSEKSRGDEVVVMLHTWIGLDWICLL